jgi:hypothetical protein
VGAGVHFSEMRKLHIEYKHGGLGWALKGTLR